MLCGSIAAQIAACEAHQQPPVLYVGNLSPTRDFLDVRDVVAALWFLAEHGQAGELYNVCSGQERAVSDVIDHLLAEARLPITLKPDPERQRPSDVPRCIGNPARLFAAGWRPHITLAQSLHDTLAWWRVALHQGPTTAIDVVPQELFGGSQSSVQVVT
jgi:GDP-4-dehydro-6-deoxy-D-mannose reductase